MIGAMQDITKLRQMQEEALEHQKQLTQATILGQENEREEIGRELHDNINQILASAKLYLEMAREQQATQAPVLEQSQQNVVKAIDEIRKLSKSFVPPAFDEYGLVDSLKEIIESVNRTNIFHSKIFVRSFDEELPDNGRKLVIYRVVQEQINNIIKYAKATEVNITLHGNGTDVVLEVTDNGVGFDTTKKSKGIGLRNIDSRISYYAGEVKLKSSPGNGTSLIVYLPI